MIDFMGQHGFVWWFGVVEDTIDPLKLGRVRVRIFGYHSEDKSVLPTGSLPWAHPLLDLTSASVSGVGKSPTGLVTGSHVFGFFRDGINAQQAVVMFSVGGIPGSTADSSVGFNDPFGKYPTEANVPDTNRLATGEQTNQTIVEQKKNDVIGPVGVAWDPFETRRWFEPKTPYKTQYPKNKVFATESGMVEEWDDTPGKERHHTYHPSGSFEEVANGWEDNPNGTRVHKIKGNNYELIAGDDYVKINGKAEVSIDGDCNILVGKGLPFLSNVNIQVEGNVNLKTTRNPLTMQGGDFRAIIDGDWDVEVNGDYRERIKGNRYSTVQANCIFNLTYPIPADPNFVGPPVTVPCFLVKSQGDIILKTNPPGIPAVQRGLSDLALSGVAPLIKLNSLSRVGQSIGLPDPIVIGGRYISSYAILEDTPPIPI